MSAERDLISKILLERDLAVVSDGGVTPAFFPSHKHREAFKFILEHYGQYTQVPSVDAFHREFDPTYKVSEPQDAAQYYVDRLTEDYQHYLLEDGLLHAVDLWESGDYDGSQNRIAALLSVLNAEITRTRITDITQTGPERLKRYKAYGLSGGALKGISSGFWSIDAATGGFQKKQLVTFVGPPKAGKSTIMLLCAMAAHRHFYKPLFIGFEMTNEEQEERHDALRAQVSHKKLRDGRLSKEDVRKLEKMMARIENNPPLLFSEDALSSSTLSGVASLVDRHKPDAVFVDGVYMMEDEQGEKKGSPQALTNLTRGFKTLAKTRELPVAISTQVLEWKMDRKKGITSNSIGYSSSFAQDSDTVIGVQKTDEEEVNLLKVVLGRNTPAMETYVKWEWETGVFEEVDSHEEPEEDDGVEKF